MEEKRYHIEESKIAGDKVCEPSPAYCSATSSVSSVSWDEAYDIDSYPMGRSLEQVMEHCESILDKLDDPNYGYGGFVIRLTWMGKKGLAILLAADFKPVKYIFKDRISSIF